MASLSRGTSSTAQTQQTSQPALHPLGSVSTAGAPLSVGRSALQATALQNPAVNPNATPPPATVVGATGASNNLGTYIDPSQTAAGKAATGAAQSAIQTQQQAARMGEQAAQGMFQQNEGAGSHLSGGLGSATMAAAGQQHLNNINAYNSQLAAWQQGIASAQQNLGSMEEGFGQAAGQNATAALGNVQSAQAAGTPTTLATGNAGRGPNYSSTTAQDALNTGAKNEMSALSQFEAGAGKHWNANGAASKMATKISSNIANLQAALGTYAPGSPEYNQIVKALQDWEAVGQRLRGMSFDSHGTYTGTSDKKNPQAHIAADALNGADPTKDPLPGGINIQGV